MIDYLALLLVNMAAGFFILASYLLSGADETAARRWAAPFGAVALVALLGGLHMSFTWPLIGSYNCAFGEMSVLFGAFFAATALALAKEWNPAPMGFYGAFSGIAAIVVGAACSRRWPAAAASPADGWLPCLPSSPPSSGRSSATPPTTSIWRGSRSTCRRRWSRSRRSRRRGTASVIARIVWGGLR